MTSAEQIGEIALIFLAFRDQLKIYHWQTHSFARHKAADGLVGIITEKMDTFMETIQGSRNMRLKLDSRSKSIQFDNIDDDGIVGLLGAFKKWLSIDLQSYLKPFDTDLGNIRDEILGNVNKAIYLFSLH